MSKKITPRGKTTHFRAARIAKTGERRSLLAAISVLGVSLGVTAADPANEVGRTNRGSAQNSSTKFAETQDVQSNQDKIKPPKLESSQDKIKSPNPQSNQIKLKPTDLQTNQDKHGTIVTPGSNMKK